MFRIRVFGVLLGLFVGSAVLAVGLTADGKGAPSVGKVFEGKVTKFDAAKRLVTLGDVKTGSDVAIGSDKGAADKSATTDKDKSGSGAGPGAGQYVFELAPQAKITLDGKAADMSDIKEGLYARIHAGLGDTSPTTDKAPACSPDAANNAQLKTDRIELFTKEAGGSGVPKEKN